MMHHHHNSNALSPQLENILNIVKSISKEIHEYLVVSQALIPDNSKTTLANLDSKPALVPSPLTSTLPNPEEDTMVGLR